MLDRGLSSDVLRYTPAKIVPALINFLSVVVLTRLLVNDQYGEYTVVLTGVSFSLVLVLSWLRQPLLRYFEKYHQTGESSLLVSSLLNTYFLILGIGLLVVSATFFIIQSIEIKWVLFSITGLILVLTRGTFSLVSTLRRAENRAGRYTVLVCANSIAQLCIAAAVIIYTPLGVLGGLLGLVIGSGLISIVELLILYNKGLYKSFVFDISTVKQSASFGLPFIGAQIGGRVLELADNYLLFVISGAAAVGTYAAGYKIFYRVVFMTFSLISLATYPRVVSVFETKGRKEAAKSFETVIRLFILLCVPAAVGLIAIGPDLVQIYVEQEYYDTIVIIPWIVLGSLFYGLGQILTYPIQLEEKTRLLMTALLFSALVNIILNFMLIPELEIQGAAIATFISYIVYTGVIANYSRNIMKFEYQLKLCTKVVGASGAIWILVSSLTQFFGGLLFLASAIPMAILTYTLVLYLLRTDEVNQAVSKASKTIRGTRS
ncbi:MULTISPECIES: lipopolysaccharide biosynthesis protein [Haloferacaceae]|uniref:Lipopolysaccharide biosynthesis protein n=1 Tax=Halorubrum glutamatedens TaxID=2707018 RepID=A0ABD5QNW1_9EURY|nr:polysaccharide biosynthesis C-terminal domain-containing protein [Halobellus captivus]